MAPDTEVRLGRIIDRIQAETGVPDLASILKKISAADLQSLLLYVFQARAAAMETPELLRNSERPLLQPSKNDARLMNEFDRIAFREARGFEAIELGPVGPLGLNRLLGGIDQNSVLTTIRNAEVLGDCHHAART